MHKEAFFCVFLSTFATRYAERKDDIVPSRILQADSISLRLREAVLDLPNVHTLDADGLSTQFVSYLFSNSLTAVVHDDDRFMFHISTVLNTR